MFNYKIDGDIDFYKELYNSLDYDSDNDKDTGNNCQITGSVLRDKFVTLECSHKFNYDALYTEICKQKFDFNSYTIDSLSKNDIKRVRDSNIDYYIKCPYCRSIQFNLLPYYDDMPFIKKYGVNTHDTDYRVVKTSYIPTYVINGSQILKLYGYIFNKGTCCKLIDMNNKQIPCYNTYVTNIIAPDGSSKHLCSIHVRDQVKQFKIEIQKKKLEDKMKAKEDKLKAKEDKMKAKEPKTKSQSQTQSNTLGNDPLEDIEEQLSSGCNAIIKTGSRKGSLCGFKIFENTMCKRHHGKNIV